jgi:hypothetical protein
VAFERGTYAGTVAGEPLGTAAVEVVRPGRTRLLGSVARPPRVKPHLEACAICGELVDPELSFCPACAGTERVAVWDERPEDAQARLLRRVEASLATEAHYLDAPDEPTTLNRADRNRVRYTRLASQRKLIRDRLLQPLSPEDREFYESVLQRVEAALARAAATLG